MFLSNTTCIYECLFFIASIEKKECGSVVSQKLGWKKFVKIVRNKPFIKKMWKRTLKRSMEQKLA